MLFNPKWEQETKADPFTLESLIAWLEKQPANGEYEFISHMKCALAQWLRSIDPEAESSHMKSSYCYDVDGASHDFESFKDIVGTLPYTFGAALERARALQARSGR